jgi:hypothetical protein
MKKLVKFFEIDLPFCGNTYGDGVSPLTGNCTAEIGVTGEQKCFNTLNYSHDCQDQANYTPAIKTLRFLQRDSGILPADLDGIPLLDDWNISGGKINAGEDMGARFVLDVKLFDGKHSDAGIDPYYAERGYIAFERGTFLGKLRARFPNIEGAECRAYQGFLGQAYEDFECFHFIAEKLQGPDDSFTARITATDFLKLLNEEKALAPKPSEGSLIADYLSGVTSVTLTPTGVGSTYSAAGRCVIGKQIFDFTRAGDVLTLAQAMTEDHKLGETVQETVRFLPQSAGLIIETLINDYSPIDSSYTDGALWASRIAEVNPYNYSREIIKPTSVRKLINELIEQVGLLVRPNLKTKKIEVDVLRPSPTTGILVDANIIEPDSFSQSDQPEKRFDNCVTYYDKRDIFSSDEPENYYSGASHLSSNIKFPTINTKIIYSQWIPAGGFGAAASVSARIVARYRRAPRIFEFALFGQNSRSHGEIIPIEHPAIQDATGGADGVRAMVLGVRPSKTRTEYIAEEYSIDAALYEGDIIIPIDYNTLNLDLRAKYNEQIVGGVVDTSPAGPAVIFIIRSGVIVGSESTSAPALKTGPWPSGFKPLLTIETGAYVVGRGGDGSNPWDDGADGGDAILAEAEIDINNLGTIGGAGGGGAGEAYEQGYYANEYVYGGGGAGYPSGSSGGGSAGDGTLTTGGHGEDGFSASSGSGGDLGEAGGNSAAWPNPSSNVGGAAGRSVVGNSLVNWVNTGTILGAQIG